MIAQPHGEIPALPETACPYCGTLAIPTLSPGKGPHFARANCMSCGKFLRWVSKYSHEERVHRREQFRRHAMNQLPPTVSQCAYLLALGYKGELPPNRHEASALIDRLRRGEVC